jgi:hypothetical protein
MGEGKHPFSRAMLGKLGTRGRVAYLRLRRKGGRNKKLQLPASEFWQVVPRVASVVFSWIGAAFSVFSFFLLGVALELPRSSLILLDASFISSVAIRLAIVFAGFSMLYRVFQIATMVDPSDATAWKAGKGTPERSIFFAVMIGAIGTSYLSFLLLDPYTTLLFLLINAFLVLSFLSAIVFYENRHLPSSATKSPLEFMKRTFGEAVTFLRSKGVLLRLISSRVFNIFLAIFLLGNSYTLGYLWVWAQMRAEPVEVISGAQSWKGRIFATNGEGVIFFIAKEAQGDPDKYKETLEVRFVPFEVIDAITFIGLPK